MLTQINARETFTRSGVKSIDSRGSSIFTSFIAYQVLCNSRFEEGRVTILLAGIYFLVGRIIGPPVVPRSMLTAIG